MKKKAYILAISLMGLPFSGCETIKPYEKEYLLNPLMDDTFVSSLTPEFALSSTARYEKLASGAQGAVGSTSCPTCGG